MLLGKFKEQSLSKNFQKKLKAMPDGRTPTSKEIHSLAILTTDKISSELDLVNGFKNNIESIRNVHIYSFKKFKKTDAVTYKHFSEKDFDWSSTVKDPSFESFLENPFDLLIGYFNEKNLYLELSSFKSKATFKIGFANVNDKIFDLVVNDAPENLESFITLIKKYLALLHKI
jgi:hypothetical protein